MAVGDIFTAALQSVGGLGSLGINSGVSNIIHSGHLGNLAIVIMGVV